MITESHQWKIDLVRRGAWLRKQHRVREWPESALVRVEQNIMVGCYCIRKLFEAKLLTDRVKNRTIPLMAYAATGKPVTLLNWHKIGELYDFEKQELRSESLGFLCNQMIHSYVFVCIHNTRGGLSSVLFASDRMRHSHLLHVSVRVLANVFEAVGRDGVCCTRWMWNEAKKDYDVKNR